MNYFLFVINLYLFIAFYQLEIICHATSYIVKLSLTCHFHYFDKQKLRSSKHLNKILYKNPIFLIKLPISAIAISVNNRQTVL